MPDEMLDLDAIRERCERADQVAYVLWPEGNTDAEADIEALIAEVIYLRERLHKCDGMANEIDINTKDNRRLRADNAWLRAVLEQ